MTLIHADCLEFLPARVETGSVDMVLTDLPYGTTRNHWDSLIDLDVLWPELLRVTKPGAAIVMTAQQPFTSILVMSQPKLYRHHWVWEKTNATGFLNAQRAPLKAHEDIIVFATKAPLYNPQKTEGHERKVATVEHKRNVHFSTNYGRHIHKGYDSTTRFPRSVQKFASDKQKSTIHPTQKPLALFEYLIRTYSNEGDLVLDVAAGSGTTEVAAIHTNRRSLCLEKDEEIYELAAARVRSTHVVD